MPIELKITGDTADHLAHELTRLAGPFLQAGEIARAVAAMQQAKTQPATPSEPVVAVGDEPTDQGGAEQSAQQVGEPGLTGGGSSTAPEPVVVEPAPTKRGRGRPPKGAAVVEKGAEPTASEAIIDKFKVVFDDHEEHFDAVNEAFERMAEHVEAAPDKATIDAFMKANEAWIAGLDEKYGKLVGILNDVVAKARAEIGKTAAAANDDGLDTPAFLKRGKTAAPAAEKPYPTLPAYNTDHARAAFRAMATDVENTLLDSDQKRQDFLVMQMKNAGAEKISNITGEKLREFVEGIVQALSPNAIVGLKQKWAEIK